MNSFGYCLQSSEHTNQSTINRPGMQNSSGQRSPPYNYYAPSSPPWSLFPLVAPVIHPDLLPASFTSGEVSSAYNAASERSLGPSHEVFPLIPDSGTVDSEVKGLPLQPNASQSDSPCGTQRWDMQQSQCICMEDTVSISQEMLGADVDFDESIHDPEPSLDFQASSMRNVNIAGTSGREDCNVLLNKLGSEPYIGLGFRSEGEAYEYYGVYAKENGFSIRKSHVERSRVDHSLISRKFVCVKQGFRSLKDKRYEGKVVRHRRVTRVDCRAAMIIKRRSGKWVVHRFHKEHNHELGDPGSSSALQSHGNSSNSTKSLLETLHKTQCIDVGDNIRHCQNTLEGDRTASDNSFQEPQPAIYMRESPNRDVNTDDTSGTGSNNVEGSPSGEVNAAEISVRGDNDASLIKLGSEPYVGLQFGSQDEAYEFYNAYAKEKGFSIRKSRIERSRIDHSMISRLYVCANQGLRSMKDKRYEGKVVRPRQETRLDCRAAMLIKRKSGKWVVERFHMEHNHDLVDPTKAEKLRSHRKMTMATKSMIEALYKCGVGPSKIVNLLTGVADGEKDILGNNGAKDILRGNEEVCANSRKKERKNSIRVECYRLLDYFQEIQAEDPGFFYAVEFGENRCMRSIFWADNKARESYKQFGDVLIFDTVCRTNKYLFPFASFTGVNHHRQTVLFGCGFLADETVESFVWFFQTWLKAMSNRHPTSIITNQDKAMKVAIEKVFPESRHRFCMWHIEKDEMENLTHVFDMHTDFRAEKKRCIHYSWTPNEFELGWEALVKKYNLKDNKWLNKLFNQRRHWVPLYLRDTFFGGRTTTQRSESTRSYFHGFLHRGTQFNEFVLQYEQAVKQRRAEEADEDFLTVFTSAVLTSKNPIEEQAARSYTRNMFTKFQQEFMESCCCSARKIGEQGRISKYLVGGKYREKDEKMHVVAFDPTENIARCSCEMFESEGMLCRHVLKVFQVVDVFEIPPQYMLKRWAMKVGDDPNVWALKQKTKSFVELGEGSHEKTNAAINILEEGLRKLSILGVQGEKRDETIWAMDLNITVPDLPRMKLKGRSVSSRMKLGIEEPPKKKRSSCPMGHVDHTQTQVDRSSNLLHEHLGESQIFTML